MIPEIPFTYASICAQIQDREKMGKHFTLVIVAEGARPKGGDFVTVADQPVNREARLGGIAGADRATSQSTTGPQGDRHILQPYEGRTMSRSPTCERLPY
jgi:ATP-dependent phosphofructokinase / diphosphate-dependent phosphofructokinase